MTKKQKEYLIIGIMLIALTKLFDASNIFLLIGLVLVFDSLFSKPKDGIEDSNEDLDNY